MLGSTGQHRVTWLGLQRTQSTAGRSLPQSTQSKARAMMVTRLALVAHCGFDRDCRDCSREDSTWCKKTGNKRSARLNSLSKQYATKQFTGKAAAGKVVEVSQDLPCFPSSSLEPCTTYTKARRIMELLHRLPCFECCNQITRLASTQH